MQLEALVSVLSGVIIQYATTSTVQSLGQLSYARQYSVTTRCP